MTTCSEDCPAHAQTLRCPMGALQHQGRPSRALCARRQQELYCCFFFKVSTHPHHVPALPAPHHLSSNSCRCRPSTGSQAHPGHQAAVQYSRPSHIY